MDIHDGHLCKSGPLGAANFGLQTNSEKSEFHGNVSVSVQFPDNICAEKAVDIRIQTLVLHVRKTKVIFK